MHITAHFFILLESFFKRKFKTRNAAINFLKSTSRSYEYLKFGNICERISSSLDNQILIFWFWSAILRKVKFGVRIFWKIEPLALYILWIVNNYQLTKYTFHIQKCTFYHFVLLSSITGDTQGCNGDLAIFRSWLRDSALSLFSSNPSVTPGGWHWFSHHDDHTSGPGQ